MDKADLAIGVGHRRNRGLIRNAGGVFVAEELDVAAERNRGNLPARSVAVIESEQLRTEADGEDEDLNAIPARDQKMAELVEEHHDGQDEQKGKQRVQDPGTPARR